RRLRTPGAELFVSDDLQEAGKIKQASLRHRKDVVVIQVPLDLQQSHHPWVGVCLDLEANDAPGSPGLQFPLQLLQEIRFNVFALFKCESAGPVNSEKIDAGDFDVPEEMVNIL